MLLLHMKYKKPKTRTMKSTLIYVTFIFNLANGHISYSCKNIWKAKTLKFTSIDNYDKATQYSNIIRHIL